MIRSFRAQLTAWYLGLLTLTFLLFGLLFYSVLARALEHRLDATLLSEVATAATLFRDEMVEMQGDEAKAAAEVVEEMNLQGLLIAVYNGRKLVAASDSGAGPAVAALAREAQSGADGLLRAPGVGPHGAHAAARRAKAGESEYVVLALRRLDTVVEDLAVVRRALYAALPVVLLIAGWGGYLLTAHKLAPLGWMAEQARRITDRNLESRLDVGAAGEELETLSAAFNELLSRLDQSFEGMRRFVADASHELRTPLAVIRGEADVALTAERTTEEYKESLAIVQDEARRLSRLVDDLLHLARADAGRVKLHIEEFYLNDVVADCCRTVQALARPKDVTVECRTGEDVPFRGDEVLIRRLVMNLLDNGIRHTPAGGAVTAAIEGSPEGVRIRVSDTGTGISEEAVPHVFERFYRGDRARSRHEGGFGLGLSIVKWIAESHNGTVELVTQAAKGTTFHGFVAAAGNPT